MPNVGDTINLNRTQYTYASNGLWQGSDGSTKTRSDMTSALSNSTSGSSSPSSSSTGAGAAVPATPVTLKYPRDLADSSKQTDWVKFEFYKYVPAYDASLGNGSAGVLDAYNASTTTHTQTLGTPADGYPSIALYMPENISASYQAKWGGRDFGPLAPIGLQMAGQILSKGQLETGALANFGANAAADANKNIGGVLPYLGASGIASAMNGIPGFGGNVQPNDILGTTTGQILNPNTEVLYQSPDLRTFNLSFKMWARSAQEAKDIRDICNTFKKASLPAGNDTQRNLINVPKVVQVTFMTDSSKNDKISQYKLSAIGNVQVDYTPNGVWSTYSDGSPVAVNLNLQFLELKLLYEGDIDSGY